MHLMQCGLNAFAGASCTAGVPQLNRHSLLPEAEALPTHHAAPHERPVQGL